ncbi:carbohydrate ABC transporter permease [Nonomuraea endophytica]|uniref:carbohydrate ABC transporter permease n=1 Tax=Nonomuraea endophytica TaxID=714136 RepID=UPI0037C7CD73
MTAVLERPPIKAAPRSRRGGSPFEAARRRMIGPFLLPALLVYALVMIVPSVITVWISFNEWAGVGAMEWAGLANYREMVADPVFGTSFANTMKILVLVGAAVFVIAFTLTMLLQDMVGRKFVRAVIFFPSLVPGLVIAILWGFLLDPDGLANSVLKSLGIAEPPLWLAPENMFTTVMAGMTWLAAGTYTVIFMAAADRIPRYFYEAAELDGAGPLTRFWHITLPLMWDVIGVCAVLWAIGALKTFEFVLVFAGATGSLPPTGLWTFSVYAYAGAFPSDGVPRYGIASAAAVLTMLLTVVLTVLVRRVMGRREQATY